MCGVTIRVKIGWPGYRVTKQFDHETKQRSLLFQGGMDSMPFPPSVGGCRVGKGNSRATSFEVIIAEKAIDETNAGNYIRNMGCTIVHAKGTIQ
nr:suppressor of ABI3-5 isoform X1 [Tanacetum cinerariifolium]